MRQEDSPEAERLRSLGGETVPGELLDANSFADAVKGCEAFIHLVGIIYERREATFEQVHVRGTLSALGAAAVGGCGRFIFMSALGTGPDARSAYHRSKWSAEEAVRGSGIPYTIFRPSTIFGADSELFKMLFQQVRRMPVIPVIGNGRYRMQPVSVLDVAACFSECLTNDKAVNCVYELGGPEALTYDEVIDTICRVMGKKRKKFHAPVALVRPVAWLSEHLQDRPFLTTDQLTMLLNDNICDIDAMRRELGVEPVALAEALAEALRVAPRL